MPKGPLLIEKSEAASAAERYAWLRVNGQDIGCYAFGYVLPSSRQDTPGVGSGAFDLGYRGWGKESRVWGLVFRVSGNWFGV